VEIAKVIILYLKAIKIHKMLSIVLNFMNSTGLSLQNMIKIISQNYHTTKKQVEIENQVFMSTQSRERDKYY